MPRENQKLLLQLHCDYDSKMNEHFICIKETNIKVT
jgi:hypothetical protein